MTMQVERPATAQFITEELQDLLTLTSMALIPMRKGGTPLTNKIALPPPSCKLCYMS